MKSNVTEMLGRVIDGRYRLDAEIGVGGMGTVYRATRLLISDEVAIKILHQDQAALPYSAERFRREAQAAARLKHPNAVSIYDFGISADGLQYLVMELVEGQSLRDIIKEKGTLIPSVAAEIVAQVCAALDEAHRQNIIHRDIKPDNIVIDQTSNGLSVKVLDFGIAKLRDQVTGHLTQTGSVVGTPHYMSPEHCMGEELDGRSDIYSLGIVLYEMLCGVVPFNAPFSMAVVVQHVNQPPPSMRALNMSISPAVEAVVMHALEKSREARPQSAGALAREFLTAVNEKAFVQAHDSLQAGSAFTPKMTEDKGAGANLMPTVSMSAPLSIGSASRGRRKTLALLVGVALALSIMGVGFWLFRLWASPRQPSSNAAMTNATSSASEPNKLPATFDKKFIGTINGDIKIEMHLQRSDNNLSGAYFYQPTGRKSMNIDSYSEQKIWADKSNELILVDIPVKGTIDDEERYVLDEVDRNGKRTGVFKGEFISPTEMKVSWSKPGGKELMSFSLKEQTSETRSSNYRIIAKRINRETKNLSVDLTYPQIEGLSNAGIQDTFNRLVQASVDETLKSAKEASADHVGEFPYSESRSFAVKYRSERFLSLLSSHSSDFGGAHPMYGTSSFNYDFQIGREIKLSHLFKSNAPYLSVIARYCVNDVNRQKRKNGVGVEVVESEVMKVLIDNETFCVTEQGLIIVFGVYHLGSFAEGEYRVLIPYSTLKNMVDSDSLLAPLVS